MGQVYEFIPKHKQSSRAPLIEPMPPKGSWLTADRVVGLCWLGAITCGLVWLAWVVYWIGHFAYLGSVLIFGNGYALCLCLAGTGILTWTTMYRRKCPLTPPPALSAPRRLHLAYSRDESPGGRRPPDDFKPPGGFKPAA